MNETPSQPANAVREERSECWWRRIIIPLLMGLVLFGFYALFRNLNPANFKISMEKISALLTFYLITVNILPA